MTVIVTGGRKYADRARVYAELDRLDPTLVVEGGATGADALAAEWASERGVQVRAYYADWHQHGRAAGPIRNARMLAMHPTAIVLVFEGGVGTADCVRQARAAGMEVQEVAK